MPKVKTMSNTVANNKKRAKDAFDQGYEAQMKGEIEKAVYLYAHSLEWYPLPETYTYLGWAYSFEGKFEKAIAQCQKAIALDPDFGNPYNDIGAYMIEMGRDQEAIPWLEKALLAKHYASRWFPYYNLGRVWERRFELAQALRCFELSLAEKEGFEPAKRALERVKSRISAEQP
jgi:tetratricopeptide (TPR) repeat protein